MNLFNFISGFSLSEIYTPNCDINQIKSYKREKPKVKINGCKYLSISLLLSIMNNIVKEIPLTQF